MKPRNWIAVIACLAALSASPALGQGSACVECNPYSQCVLTDDGSCECTQKERVWGGILHITCKESGHGCFFGIGCENQSPPPELRADLPFEPVDDGDPIGLLLATLTSDGGIEEGLSRGGFTGRSLENGEIVYNFRYESRITRQPDGTHSLEATITDRATEESTRFLAEIGHDGRSGRGVSIGPDGAEQAHYWRPRPETGLRESGRAGAELR